MDLSCECRVPQFRHRGIAPAEFARLELSLLDLLCQLDSADRYDRVVESLESQHGPDSLLHPPVVLLHQIVQILARSNLLRRGIGSANGNRTCMAPVQYGSVQSKCLSLRSAGTRR